MDWFFGSKDRFFRITKVNPNGPCKNAELTPYFDFIVSVDGDEEILGRNGDFLKLIQEHKVAKTPMTLTIYNFYSNLKRDVIITPFDWGGDGSLGLLIVRDSFDNAEERCIHVLDVPSDSGAAKSGLIPYEDYILGTTDTIFSSLKVLSNFVSSKRAASVFVFNSKTKIVREINLVLVEGRLGCDVAQGYLHRLPVNRIVSVSDPNVIVEECVKSLDPISIDVDAHGTVAFLSSIYVMGTDQVITIPFVVYPISGPSAATATTALPTQS